MSDTLEAGRPVIVRYETASGVIVHITPLSPFTIAAIRERAEQEHPYPDPEPYRMALQNAADPSIKEPAENNPEYQALCKPIVEARYAWRLQAYIDISCAYPDFANADVMIAHFRPRLEALRKVTVMDDDDWLNVLNHCVFTGSSDRQDVINLAIQNETIPLTPAEVVEGIRFFRVEVQGEAARRLAGQQPRRAEVKGQNGEQPTRG